MGVELTTQGKTTYPKENLMLSKAVSLQPDPQHISSRRDAWMRWVRVWHIVFYLSLALPTYLTYSSGTMRYSTWLILGLSLFLGIWYGLIMMWLVPKAQGKIQTILSLVFLVVALAIWFPLSRATRLTT
jgi:hypothetical protein